MKNQEHIIKASIQGDQRAQRELYEAYRVRWFMVSMRYGKNRMQAEDILQEGLVNIYRNLKSYDATRAAFSTWSTRVLINAALAYLKKSSWNDALTNLDDLNDQQDSDETIYDKLSAKELTKLIQDLPVGYRLTFNMYVVEGYKHKEIAEALGISVGTSKSQLARARRELRNKLESQLTASGHE